MKKIDFSFVVTFVCLFSVCVASKNEWNAYTVDQFSYNLMKEENLEIHDTKLFRHRSGLHVRHDLEIHLALKLHKHCDEPFGFRLIENKSMTIFTWSQQPLIQKGEFHFRLYVNQTIPVGQYALNVSDPCSKEAVQLCDINVMFNPRPDTFGHKKVRRQTTRALTDEYLNNNYGYIWVWGGGLPWTYAVGSDVVTRSRNHLIQLMSREERSNQIQFSRALTRLIGNNVLLGRWNGDYSGGVEPTQWVGSEEILARWLQSGQKVRYAQCWVFAAILTTILRASGISARTVTNYGSHHDRGLTSDQTAVLRQYDNIVQLDESTWNFHVWSEAWLQRPDLGQPAGWNAVDATPQEPSPLAPGQPYRAGPAYVPFIRSNMRTANYDTYFILAEVNAKKICPVTGEPLETNIGYAVVTKRQGNLPVVYNFNNPDFITNDYKIPSVSKRASGSPVLPPPYTGCEREGGMRLNSTPPSPQVGEDFIITVTEGNVSVEDTVIRMELRNYMGESLGIIRNFTGIRRLNVAEFDYLPYLNSSNIFRFTVGVYNQPGNFVFHDDLLITLEYSQVQVNTMKGANSDTIILILNYVNPLSVSMTGVMVNIASPNETYMMMEQPDIPANGRFTATIGIRCGNNTDSNVMIPVSLDSDVTQSVYGTGLSSCREGSPNSGTITLSEISLMLISLALCIFI